jgi:hypothetical protein
MSDLKLLLIVSFAVDQTFLHSPALISFPLALSVVVRLVVDLPIVARRIQQASRFFRKKLKPSPRAN